MNSSAHKVIIGIVNVFARMLTAELRYCALLRFISWPLDKTQQILADGKFTKALLEFSFFFIHSLILHIFGSYSKPKQLFCHRKEMSRSQKENLTFPTTTTVLLKALNGYRVNGLKSPIRGSEIDSLLKVYTGDSYGGLYDLIPASDNDFLVDPSHMKSNLSFSDLAKFIREEGLFDLRQFGVPFGSRVGLIFPNGAELAVGVIALLCHWCVLPINYANTLAETETELRDANIVAVIAYYELPYLLKLTEAKFEDQTTLTVLCASPDSFSLGLFSITQLTNIKVGAKPRDTTTENQPMSKLTPAERNSIDSDPLNRFVPQSPSVWSGSSDGPEHVLLLFTSGTSGKKKLVPYSLNMIVVGVGCIISAWDLTQRDVCLNMMPLFHIGGIVRNVLSPLLSGGSVIPCSAFDPVLFWDLLFQFSSTAGRISSHPTSPVTWYYAAPAMHHAILAEARNRPTPLSPVSEVRFIANAAGALLPSLAQSLQRTFSSAKILSGYGMTECMPISSPPLNALEAYPVGTSGKPIGPEVIICDEEQLVPLPAGKTGNIFIRGSPCFAGYENDAAANTASFVTINGTSGWFNTGDCGYFDENSYLFLTGRSKEIINRGGETISPFEIEEMVTLHPLVEKSLAFSAPHDILQETIGIIVVLNDPLSPCQLDLSTLHEFLTGKLHRNKWPQVILFSSRLPRNATGKILRIKMAERTGLPELSDSMHVSDRLYSVSCPAIGAPLTSPMAISKIDHQEAAIHCSELISTVLPSLTSSFRVTVLTIGNNPNFVTLFYSHDSLEPSEVEAVLAGKVPVYFMPSMICPVSTLPSTVDEAQNVAAKRLDDLRQTQNRSQTERDVIEILTTCLNIAPETIAGDDNFFDLGGDSLKAGQLASAIRKTFPPILFSVGEIFSNPTPHQLAHYLKSTKRVRSFKLSSASSSMSTLSTPNNLTLIIGAGNCSARERLLSTSQDDLVILDSESSAMKIIEGLEQNLHTYCGDELPLSDVNGFLEGTEKIAFNYAPSPHRSDSWKVYIVQLIPIAFVWPIKKMLSYILVIYAWWLMLPYFGRSLGLFVGIYVASLINAIVLPLIGVSFKWILLGRCEVGRYHLWSNDYLRWWLADSIVSICGIGVYDKVTYMKFLGAKIGSNVKISGDVNVGIALDVLIIEDNTVIDGNTHVRTITFESGYFLFLPIHIKKNCCICSKCIVVAGSFLPENTVMGPLSSSYDIAKEDGSTDEKWRHYCREPVKSPPSWMKYCILQPFLLFYFIYSRLPILAGIYLMFELVKLTESIQQFSSLYDLILWWTTPTRIGLYLMLKFIKISTIPFYQLLFVILFKFAFIGKFKPRLSSIDEAGDHLDLGGIQSDENWYRLKYSMMKKLLPDNTLCGTLQLVGSHYEVVSMIYRLLGATVGKRVYWPGSGLNVVEYDLLTIGDDVVFGSRSLLMMSSSHHSAPIVIKSGSMIADRCVILPGVVVGEHAVLGSGALAFTNTHCTPGSVWVGSVDGSAVEIDKGDASMADKPAVSPFGKAFYLRDADYFVFPLSLIVAYSLFFSTLGVVWHTLPTVISAYAAVQFNGRSTDVRMFILFAFLTIFVLSTIATFGALIFDVLLKWCLIGRRVAGTYSWDTSSYCQRWQVHLSSQEVRKVVINLFRGTPYLVKYFQCLGCNIGEEVCLYPCGGDPMMTEPDLVTIGDYSVVDDASIIGHINSRGVFKLNPLTIGKNCSLKSFSRLLSGAAMEDRSMMLEHTLVMGGETVESQKAWQGWPSSMQVNANVPYLYNQAIVAHSRISTAIEDVSIMVVKSDERVDIEMGNEMA